jgi:hypothetical protein
MMFTLDCLEDVMLARCLCYKVSAFVFEMSKCLGAEAVTLYK